MRKRYISLDKGDAFFVLILIMVIIGACYLIFGIAALGVAGRAVGFFIAGAFIGLIWGKALYEFRRWRAWQELVTTQESMLEAKTSMENDYGRYIGLYTRVLEAGLITHDVRRGLENDHLAIDREMESAKIYFRQSAERTFRRSRSGLSLNWIKDASSICRQAEVNCVQVIEDTRDAIVILNPGGSDPYAIGSDDE